VLVELGLLDSFLAGIADERNHCAFLLRVWKEGGRVLAGKLAVEREEV